MGIKFLVVLVFAALGVALLSLAWPLVSPAPRPDALTNVRNVIIGTDVGRNVAAVLGVADEAAVIPIDPNQVVQSVAQGAVGAVEKRASDVIVLHATRELVTRFNQLSPNQKDAIRSIVCSQ